MKRTAILFAFAAWSGGSSGCDGDAEKVVGIESATFATTTYDPLFRLPPTSTSEAVQRATETFAYYTDGQITPDSVTCSQFTFKEGHKGYKCVIKDTLPTHHPRGPHVRSTTLFIQPWRTAP